MKNYIDPEREKILDKINEHSAIVANGDISDIRQDLEYLKDLDNNMSKIQTNENLLTNGNNQNKRKPFGKINFS